MVAEVMATGFGFCRWHLALCMGVPSLRNLLLDLLVQIPVPIPDLPPASGSASEALTSGNGHALSSGASLMVGTAPKRRWQSPGKPLSKRKLCCNAGKGGLIRLHPETDVKRLSLVIKMQDSAVHSPALISYNP